MRRIDRWNLIWGLSGLVIGAAVTFTAFIMLVHGATIVERRSPYDFATTVQTIANNASSRGWNVNTIQGFRTALERSADLKNTPVEVIELCHPDYACSMLRHGKRSCLAMMPCSVAVYERNGEVYIAALNRGFIGRFYRESASVLDRVREEERQILDLSRPRLN